MQFSVSKLFAVAKWGWDADLSRFAQHLVHGHSHSLRRSTNIANATRPPVARYPPMHRKPITIAAPNGADWKALGYITSIVSVFFLGCAAWLKQGPPWWYHPALIIGMTTSILGMGFRYKSHLDEQREISKAEEEAEKPAGANSLTTSGREQPLS